MLHAGYPGHDHAGREIEPACPALYETATFPHQEPGTFSQRRHWAELPRPRFASPHDQEVARLVKRTALAAGVRGDLSEGEHGTNFSGHSLRADLASSAEVDERYVQKQLGHASAEMTRRYQRQRDRFRVNLTKASRL